MDKRRSPEAVSAWARTISSTVKEDKLFRIPDERAVEKRLCRKSTRERIRALG